jgi:hypothetical protein
LPCSGAFGEAKEAASAQGNDADAERQTSPLQNISHLHPIYFS